MVVEDVADADVICSMFDEFTHEEYKEICEKAMLNDELKAIFEMKIKGYSITKIADLTHLSERTVNRRIKVLKKKVIKVL